MKNCDSGIILIHNLKVGYKLQSIIYGMGAQKNLREVPTLDLLFCKVHFYIFPLCKHFLKIYFLTFTFWISHFERILDFMFNPSEKN